MRRRAVAQIEHNLVDIAPAPALGWVVTFDDRVPCRLEVSCRVPVRRVVAAPDMAAGPAQAQMYPGRTGLQALRGIVVACAGCAFATAALVEKNDRVSLRVEKVNAKLVASRARPAMQKHNRLAVCRTVFFPINPVKRVLLDSLMPRFIAG
jgi:hypothetical protein